VHSSKRHPGPDMAMKKYKAQVVLGEDSHVMQWNPALQIFRVNRYQRQFSLEEKLEKYRYEASKLDFLEELLLRNLDHCAEYIISCLDFEDQLTCLVVCQLWNEFIGGHVFKRKVEAMVENDEGLQELAEQEQWNTCLYIPSDEVLDCTVYKKMLAKIFLLKDMWRCREPKAKRLFCDSFVLSIKCDDDKIFCGLNNGCIQAWDLATLGKTREQECHDKGVKCIDMNNKVFLTGSYDTTFKVWRKDDWSCVKIFPCHTDSVWDLRLHDNCVATAGLDGTVIMYDFVSDYELIVRCYIQAHGDLVSAVDFGPDYLVTGYEDSNVGVWSLPAGQMVHNMEGHNGGVTGVQMQLNMAATSSYDATVRLWDVEQGTCLKEFKEPQSFCRCVAFHGNRIVSGDFGGNVHFWDISFSPTGKLCVDNHRAWECHKGHVVCIQLNACRIISGSRDKTLMINDFWLKTIDSLGPKETTTKRMSRFLNRPIFDL